MRTESNRGLRSWRSGVKGAEGVRSQPSEWLVAGPGQREETAARGEGVDPITIKTRGNCAHI